MEVNYGKYLPQEPETMNAFTSSFLFSEEVNQKIQHCYCYSGLKSFIGENASLSNLSIEKKRCLHYFVILDKLQRFCKIKVRGCMSRLNINWWNKTLDGFAILGGDKDGYLNMQEFFDLVMNGYGHRIIKCKDDLIHAYYSLLIITNTSGGLGVDLMMNKIFASEAFNTLLYKQYLITKKLTELEILDVDGNIIKLPSDLVTSEVIERLYSETDIDKNTHSCYHEIFDAAYLRNENPTCAEVDYLMVNLRIDFKKEFNNLPEEIKSVTTDYLNKYCGIYKESNHEYIEFAGFACTYSNKNYLFG